MAGCCPAVPTPTTPCGATTPQARRHRLDAKIDWKALSQCIGHADVAFTMKQYVQADLEADRQVANTLAELIIGGSLASIEITKGTVGAADSSRDTKPGRAGAA